MGCRALWGPMNETIFSISEDTTLLVTASLDQCMGLFETKTLALIRVFDSERPLNSCTISPLNNCPYVICGGGQDAMSVTTTAAAQGKFESVFYDHVFDDELGNIGGHFGPINTLAFAPHGRSFTSGGEDGYIRVHHFDPEYFEAYEKKVAEAQGN